MANTLLYNLAAMTVTSTGTGTITLGSAARINGVLYLSFASAGISNGDIVAYSILDPTGQSEVGFGTYTASGTTLTRNPTTSTNANAAINMSAASIVIISPRLQDIGTPGQRPATNTNDSATAGNVGEVVTSSVAVGAAVSITANTPANVTSIALTAGDWDVSGEVYINPAATTNVTFLEGSISTTTTTRNTNPGGFTQLGFIGGGVIGGGFLPSVPIPVNRINLSASGTAFLVVDSSFTLSTNAAFGYIYARRAR